MWYYANFVQRGEVEFKYRKDTQMSNGQFKFLVNGDPKLSDEGIESINDWQIFRTQIDTPGHYILTWIYTKYNIPERTSNMTAEIEYLKLEGTKMSAFECITCKEGWSKAGSDRCS